MQRTMKKTLSFVLALALVFSMSIGLFSTQAFAAGGTNLIIQVSQGEGENAKTEEELAGYQYVAYQIFSGTYSEDEEGNGVLTSIDWGSGVDKTLLAQQYEAINTLLGTTLTADTIVTAEGAQAVAEALSSASAANAKVFANIIAGCVSGTYETSSETGEDGQATFEDLADGYYLVMTSKVPDGNDTAYTDYILVTVGGGEDIGPVEDKEEVPHSDKTIDDTNDSDTSDDGANVKGGTSADYDIGDEVPFTLKGWVSESYVDFTDANIPYTTTFHDVMTSGLTFNSSSVEVYIVHGTTETLVYDGNTVTSSYVELNTNPEDTCDFELTITDFNALLAEFSINDFDASTDYIKVTFTATLNESALIGNNKAEDSDYGDGTYGNMNKSWIDYSNDAHNSSHKGTTAEVEVQVFTYTVIVNKYGDTTDVPLEGATFTLEKLIDGEGSDEFLGYSGTWTTVSTQTATADENGKYNVFTWTGIDDGVYRISETGVPDGYNQADDIYLVVTATHEPDGSGGYKTTLSVATYDEDGNVISDGAFVASSDSGGLSTGEIIGDVLNLSGAVLPSTGGIGTYIFYIIGGAIVVCAAVVLVTRRRMRRAA